MTSPAEHDPAEPRFAGSVPWVPADPAPPLGPPSSVGAPPSPWASEAPAPVDAFRPIDYGSQYGDGSQYGIGYPLVEKGIAPLAPVVNYGAGLEAAGGENPAARLYVSPAWLPAVLAIVGGIFAGIGSLFTWATLSLASQGGDVTAGGDSVSTITYNGLSLLEGRVLLVFGVAACGLGIVALLGRLRPTLLASWLCLVGALGLIVAGFAAIGHPVELATLFRSYREIDSVKVSLPDGVGVWLALGGAALILTAGLLARTNQQAAERFSSSQR